MVVVRRLLGLLMILGILGGLGWGGTKIKWVSRETWEFEDKTYRKEKEVEVEDKGDLDEVEKIKAVTADDQGEYSVSVYRLSDGSSYGFNQTEVMPARSLLKILVMVAALNRVGAGDLSINQLVTLQAEDRDSGSGGLYQFPTGTQLTVDKLLYEMGNKSDNTARNMIKRLISPDDINQAMKDLKMQQTNFDQSETTAKDVAEMWKNLYKNPYWEELKGYLTDSIYEDRIAVGIPEGTTLVHKVGTDIDIWNDSGIIIPQGSGSRDQGPGNGQPFILVILNNDVDLAEAKKTVPEITRMVWDYESSR